jgi:hypothetical protein
MIFVAQYVADAGYPFPGELGPCRTKLGRDTAYRLLDDLDPPLDAVAQQPI